MKKQIKLDDVIEEALEMYPDKVAKYLDGETGLVGLFMGHVMKRTKGVVDPKKADKRIREKLEEKKNEFRYVSTYIRKGFNKETVEGMDLKNENDAVIGEVVEYNPNTGYILARTHYSHDMLIIGLNDNFVTEHTYIFNNSLKYLK